MGEFKYIIQPHFLIDFNDLGCDGMDISFNDRKKTYLQIKKAFLVLCGT